MSPCFQYLPPGYIQSSAKKEALIELIKLHKGGEKAKEPRKEKEKSWEKEERVKQRMKEKEDKKNQNLDKSDIVKRHIGQKICSDARDYSLYKRREAETEERSSLTEEHGQFFTFPVCSSSSDSTENSNKRMRRSSSVDCSHGHGKDTSTRLPLRKQGEFFALAKKQTLCSTSFQVGFPAENFCSTLDRTSYIDQGFTLRTNGEQICSTSEQIDAGKTGIKSVPKTALTSIQRVGLQYKYLLENCVPPLVQYNWLDQENLDWLIQGKNQDTWAEKRRRSGSESILCSTSSTLWPCARYLHEIGTFAMPFTVPY